MRRRARHAVGRVAGILAAVGSAACVHVPREEAAPPTGKLDRSFVYQSDGTVDLAITVTLELPAGARDRHFTLDRVRLVEPGGGAHWTSAIRGPLEGWPATVRWDGFELVERSFILDATAVAPGGVAPDATVEVTLVGDDATFVVVPVFDHVESTTGECSAPLVAEMPGPLGASLAWSVETLGGIVEQPLDLVAAPNGDAWLLASYTGDQNERVFAVSDGHASSVLELPGLSAVAAGDGAGPSTVTTVPDPSGIGSAIVTHRDTRNSPVWSHELADVQMNARPVVATSGGRVLVGVSLASQLLLDGVAVDGVIDPDELLLFDEPTGALVSALPGLRANAMEPLLGGAFAITTDETGQEVLHVLEADLSVRWTKLLGSGRANLATTPDGTVWVHREGVVERYDASGAPAGSTQAPSGTSIAPLEDGGFLVGTDHGVARVWPDGTSVTSSFREIKVAWCGELATWWVARTPGGAVAATRPRFIGAGTADGRAIIAGLAFP